MTYLCFGHWFPLLLLLLLSLCSPAHSSIIQTIHQAFLLEGHCQVCVCVCVCVCLNSPMQLQQLYCTLPTIGWCACLLYNYPFRYTCGFSELFTAIHTFMNLLTLALSCLKLEQGQNLFPATSTPMGKERLLLRY